MAFRRHWVVVGCYSGSKQHAPPQAELPSPFGFFEAGLPGWATLVPRYHDPTRTALLTRCRRDQHGHQALPLGSWPWLLGGLRLDQGHLGSRPLAREARGHQQGAPLSYPRQLFPMEPSGRHRERAWRVSFGLRIQSRGLKDAAQPLGNANVILSVCRPLWLAVRCAVCSRAKSGLWRTGKSAKVESRHCPLPESDVMARCLAAGKALEKRRRDGTTCDGLFMHAEKMGVVCTSSDVRWIWTLLNRGAHRLVDEPDAAAWGAAIRTSYPKATRAPQARDKGG